jgi:chromosome partitioning protein
MRVISVVNYKGGVGKTTLTANLGAELAHRGKRVLLIDLDPQCSLSQCFYTTSDYQMKVRPKQTLKRWYETFDGGVPQASLAEFIVTPADVNHVIRGSGGQLDLLASDVLLFKLDLDVAQVAAGADVDHEVFLRRRALLDALSERAFPPYDFVLLDCAPNFGLLTQTALVASRDVLMPAKADYLSTVGLDTLWGAIHQFRKDYADQVRRYGGRHAGGAFDVGAYLVVFTMVEFMRKRPAPAHEHYMTIVQKQQRIPSFKSVIRQSVTVFGYKNAHVVPPVLQLKPADQIRGELVELTSEFLRHFDAPKGGRVAA